MGHARRATPYGEPPGTEERYRQGEVIRERYHLVRPLGQGGFGRVWVALDSLLDTHVAVKIIYLEPDAAPAHSERLLAEARASARFRHPAIVRVFDFGQTERGDPFVAMEMLHGQSLYELMVAEGRIAGPRLVQLLLPIADALQTAHSAGIVHRDVKPENVFVATDDLGRVQPKLLDFGIARQTDVDRRLTAKGAIVGTPDYMSPEQARGAEVDARTDVWSFSVLLYEALTAQVPFKADNYHALLNSIINDAPVPTHQQSAGDLELWRLIDRGLKKSPDDRWESMRAFGEALALWGYERGTREDACGASLRTSWLEADFAELQVVINSTQPPPVQLTTKRPDPRDPDSAVTRAVAPPPPPRSRWPWLAAGAVVAALVGAGVVAASRPSPELPDVQAVGQSPPPADVPAASTTPAAQATPSPLPSAEPSRASPKLPQVAPAARPLASPLASTAPPPRPPSAPPAPKAKPKSTAPDFGF
ncbi:MAG: protein kinase [Myxococcales bacterium]|nr:protein kinase [Myxococcales bacterium]